MTAARQRLLPGPAGAVVRDLDAAIAARTPRITVVEFTAVYQAPLVVAFPRPPLFVLCVRMLLDSDPEEVTAVIATVHFNYRNGAIRMNEVEGADDGERYRFVFLVGEVG